MAKHILNSVRDKHIRTHPVAGKAIEEAEKNGGRVAFLTRNGLACSNAHEPLTAEDGGECVYQGKEGELVLVVLYPTKDETVG